jgi:hypothetical protein
MLQLNDVLLILYFILNNAWRRKSRFKCVDMK